MKNDIGTAIVTGASSGIGLAIAKRMLDDGYTVTIVARHEDKLKEAAHKLGGNVRWAAIDLSECDTAYVAIKELAEALGTVTVLVNNAGSTRSVSSTSTVPQAFKDWENIINTNLRSTFISSLSVIPNLASPGGRIINISSIAAQTGSRGPGGLAYAAAKAGVLGFTKSLARELGAKGITVNAIAPGLVKNTGFFGAPLPPERIRLVSQQTPLGRAGEPEEIAAAVSWLASSESSFITGATISVNGGWHIG